MPNYQNSKIYTLRSYIRPDLIYVGSTVEQLSTRMAKHRCTYKRYKTGKGHYVTSFKLFDECADTYIELHENYPCANRETLCRREGEVIRTVECVNKRIEGRTKKEYYTDHIEKTKKYLIKYRVDNKEYNAAYKKKYNIDNRKYIAQSDKQKYQKNKETILERNKQNRIKKGLYEKIKCVCGQVLTRGYLIKHQQTKKHHKQFEIILHDFIHS